MPLLLTDLNEDVLHEVLSYLTPPSDRYSEHVNKGHLCALALTCRFFAAIVSTFIFRHLTLAPNAPELTIELLQSVLGDESLWINRHYPRITLDRIPRARGLQLVSYVRSIDFRWSQDRNEAFSIIVDLLLENRFSNLNALRLEEHRMIDRTATCCRAGDLGPLIKPSRFPNLRQLHLRQVSIAAGDLLGFICRGNVDSVTAPLRLKADECLLLCKPGPEGEEGALPEAHDPLTVSPNGSSRTSPLSVLDLKDAVLTDVQLDAILEMAAGVRKLATSIPRSPDPVDARRCEPSRAGRALKRVYGTLEELDLSPVSSGYLMGFDGSRLDLSPFTALRKVRVHDCCFFSNGWVDPISHLLPRTLETLEVKARSPHPQRLICSLRATCSADLLLNIPRNLVAGAQAGEAAFQPRRAPRPSLGPGYCSPEANCIPWAEADQDREAPFPEDSRWASEGWGRFLLQWRCRDCFRRLKSDVPLTKRATLII